MKKEKFGLIFLICISINSVLMPSVSAQDNTLAAGGTFAKVEGDWKRFREDNWMDRNLTSGVEEFYLDKNFKGGRRLTMGFSGTSDYNYNLALDFSREEFCYLRINHDAFRKYYDDSGDYFLFANPATDPSWYTLDKDIYADRANTSVEFGLTLPDHPKYILGYERRTRDGEELLRTRGMVTDTAPAPDVSKFIYPWAKEVHWVTDTFKVGTEFAIKGINIALNQQYQQFSDGEHYDNVSEVRDNAFNPIRQKIKTEDKPTAQSITTTFLADSQVNPALRMKVGYALNKHTSNTHYDSRVSGSDGTLWTTSNYYDGEATSDLAAQAINWGMNLKIIDSLTFRGGLRYRISDSATSSEYRRSAGSTGGTLYTGLHTQKGNVGESNTGESVALTYKGIPRTSIYAEGSAEQLKADYSMRGREYDYPNSTDLVWQSKALYFKENYACGINTRPIKPLFVSLSYKRKAKENDYKDEYDSRERSPLAVPTAAGVQPFFQYPGYIGENTRLSDEYSLRTNITPNRFISFGLKYQETHTAYNVVKEQYEEIGSVDDRTASASVTVTPTDKLYFNTLYSRDEMLLKTPAADARTNLFRTEGFLSKSSSILSSVNYTLNDKTTLSGQYQTWHSDNDTSLGGYAGIEREVIKNILLKVGYSYYLYSEDYPNADVNDYKAHVGSVSLTGKF